MPRYGVPYASLDHTVRNICCSCRQGSPFRHRRGFYSINVLLISRRWLQTEPSILSLFSMTSINHLFKFGADAPATHNLVLSVPARTNLIMSPYCPRSPDGRNILGSNYPPPWRF